MGKPVLAIALLVISGCKTVGAVTAPPVENQIATAAAADVAIDEPVEVPLEEFLSDPQTRERLEAAYVVGRSCVTAGWSISESENKEDCRKFFEATVVRQVFTLYKKSDDQGKSDIEELVSTVGDHINSDVNGHLYYGGDGDMSFNKMGRPDYSKVTRSSGN